MIDEHAQMNIIWRAKWTVLNCKIIVSYCITWEVTEKSANNKQDKNDWLWVCSFLELTYFNSDNSFMTGTLDNINGGAFVRKKMVFGFILICVFILFVEINA